MSGRPGRTCISEQPAESGFPAWTPQYSGPTQEREEKVLSRAVLLQRGEQGLGLARSLCEDLDEPQSVAGVANAGSVGFDFGAGDQCGNVVGGLAPDLFREAPNPSTMPRIPSLVAVAGVRAIPRRRGFRRRGSDPAPIRVR